MRDQQMPFALAHRHGGEPSPSTVDRSAQTHRLDSTLRCAPIRREKGSLPSVPMR